MKTVIVKGIVPHAFVKPWRHPVWWWKLRHLRRDLRRVPDLVNEEIAQQIREAEERAFLSGEGK